MEMFCLKCRRKVTVEDSSVDESSVNGRRLIRASCPECSSNLARFMKATSTT
ncbi:hypothetical protein KEJ39_03535 [Candidatus Bathyarchaeota archaeon]|nr:hypothetical protein [Candidatus Bathyarchaeota archaeon]